MLQRFIHHAMIQDISAGARLISRMPAFLRRPVTTEESKQALARRLAQRPAIFLELMRHAVFEIPLSVNFQLFRHAGCELGDLENLVHCEGIEGALGKLLRQGVFLTVDELKGRRPILRGSTTISLLRRGAHCCAAVAPTQRSKGRARAPADHPDRQGAARAPVVRRNKIIEPFPVRKRAPRPRSI